MVLRSVYCYAMVYLFIRSQGSATEASDKSDEEKEYVRPPTTAKLEVSFACHFSLSYFGLSVVPVWPHLG